MNRSHEKAAGPVAGDAAGVSARPAAPQPDLPSEDRLNGWKEIAVYLGRSIRAVQRWERDLGLPVHRVRTVAGQTAYASRREIDQWRASRDLRRAIPPSANVPRAWRHTRVAGLAVAGLATLIAALMARCW